MLWYLTVGNVGTSNALAFKVATLPVAMAPGEFGALRGSHRGLRGDRGHHTVLHWAELISGDFSDFCGMHLAEAVVSALPARLR